MGSGGPHMGQGGSIMSRGSNIGQGGPHMGPEGQNVGERSPSMGQGVSNMGQRDHEQIIPQNDPNTDTRQQYNQQNQIRNQFLQNQTTPSPSNQFASRDTNSYNSYIKDNDSIPIE